jgi:hypothetical protein
LFGGLADALFRPHFGRAMLQRLQSLDEELLPGDGVWPRDRLLAMDASYVAAVERAFELGLESRAAAGATVSFRNGKAAAIEGAWNSLISKRGEIAASEVVAYVRARCPGVDVPRIRFGIEQRFRQRGARW